MISTSRTSRSTRKLPWIAVSIGAAAAGAILAFRYYRQRLEGETTRLLEILNLRPGMNVAEVGAGKGRMTIRVAQQVRSGGCVLSTESKPRRLRKIRRSARKRGLENITVLEGSETGQELPPDSFDAIFMRGVYHHFTAPQEMDRSLFRALRPGGKLVVIDFSPRLLLSLCPPKGIPENRRGHGIRKELLKRELTQAGFEPVREYDDWPFRLYCLTFRKPAA
ncbi:MAG: class I SAM-dependent methyltransferase [Terriglobales bacterium]